MDFSNTDSDSDRDATPRCYDCDLQYNLRLPLPEWRITIDTLPDEGRGGGRVISSLDYCETGEVEEEEGNSWEDTERTGEMKRK